MAPLLDADRVRLEGHVPERATSWPTAGHAAESPPTPLVLSVFGCGRTEQWLTKPQATDTLDAVHQVVYRAWLDAQRQHDPEQVLHLAHGLEPLKRQELLPETRLLLALLPGVAREIQHVRGLQAVNTLCQALSSLTIAAPQHYRNVTLFPLQWQTVVAPAYTLLSQAIAAKTAVVEEISAAGSVPELRLTNLGDRPVLVPEGEILVGAKQNRVVNITVLVTAKSTFVVPVSCVEQGRWQHVGRHFQAAYCAPPSLRSKKLRSVQRNRSTRGVANSDQHEVWRDVEERLVALNVHSPTASLTDGFDRQRQHLDQYRRKLPLPPTAAGVLVGRGTTIVGVDLFDSPAAFQILWPSLADAYFLDVLYDEAPTEPTPLEAADSLLRNLGSCAKPRIPAIGLGDELEIAGNGVVGAALIFDGRVCHLSAFAAPQVT